MTGWSDIIAGTAMTLINDLRWREELAANPAQFFRAKSQYVSLALPLLSRPPELLKYLQTGMISPTWADQEWTSTLESTTQETTISTGLMGFDLFSCSVISAATHSVQPYNDATYDPVTGIVTFPPQATAGITYSLDFYTDGQFPALTPSQMRLFGLAVAIVWDERFDRDWISIQMKIHDQSFDVPNEANYMKQTNARKIANRAALDDELRKYEQDCAFATVMAKTAQTTELI